MVCAGAREARLHEDVLEMKVLLAQKIFLKARFARALRAYLARRMGLLADSFDL